MVTKIIGRFLLSAFFILSSMTVWANEKDFWWGISTSSYQTEDTDHSFATDWDVFTRNGRLAHDKGHGTYSFSEYMRDFNELEFLGVSHYRYSLEWARIEPEPGRYNLDALSHYLEMARELQARGIEPMICLWHFTFPDWALGASPKESGWLNPMVQQRWKLFVELVTREFSALNVRLYAPMNEPNAQALAAYFLGIFPPMQKFKASLYHSQISKAVELYNEAADVIHSIHSENKVITVQNLIFWEQAKLDPFGYFRKLGERYNFDHLDGVSEKSDYIGFNYYYRTKASPFGKRREVYPAGMYHFIRVLSEKYSKPILITENGIGTEDDKQRQSFMDSHIAEMQRARKEGYDVKGYMFWSLIDNYEWSAGYTRRFGIYQMDEAKNLIPKDSALLYKKIIQGE